MPYNYANCLTRYEKGLIRAAVYKKISLTDTIDEIFKHRRYMNINHIYFHIIDTYNLYSDQPGLNII